MALSRRIFLQGLSAAGLGSLVRPSWAAFFERPNGTPAKENMETVEEAHPLTSVPVDRVVVDDAFWSPKIQTWRTVTLRDCFHKFETEEGGAFNNFDKVRDGQNGGHAGPPWTDGLVYEMIRAAADFLRNRPDPELERQVDGYIDRIVAAAAKDPDGYVNTYTQLGEPDHRWGLNGGLEIWQHEFYNLGAMIEAGVHYYRATGKTALLAAGATIANTMFELIGPPPKRSQVPGHELPEEALLAMFELFREQPAVKAKLPMPIDERNYLSLAEYWIENRGHNIGQPDWEKDHGKAEQFVRDYRDYDAGRPSWGDYAQDAKPILEQDQVVGHAVRSTLLCSAVAATARVNGREDYRRAAVRLWENMVYRRMHVTGGVGAYAQDEKFGADYALPNDAYLETCAAVGAGFFHHNMNLTFGHARYVDELERTLYNGTLSGVSLKGDTYFYQNPLEADESRERWSWNGCPCCPPMFLKIMGAMPGYVYATDADGLYVNLFVGSHATAKVKGTDVAIRQKTNYPWDGAVHLAVDPARPAEFALLVRVPAWCRGASLRVNGETVSTHERVRGYVRIAREWRAGDAVELDLPMPVEAVSAHPKVAADVGRTALTRGPLVYCVESVDNPDQAGPLILSRRPDFATRFWPDRLGGVVAIEASAVGAPAEMWERTLYAAAPPPETKARRFVAIPYYANANRGPVRMAVWLPRESGA